MEFAQTGRKCLRISDSKCPYPVSILHLVWSMEAVADLAPRVLEGLPELYDCYCLLLVAAEEEPAVVEEPIPASWTEHFQ